MPVTESFLKERTIRAKTDFDGLLIKSLDCAWEFKNKYSSEDCRYKFFAHFFELNGWLILQLDEFLRLLESQQIKFNEKTLDAKHRLTFLDQFDTINRANYCTTGIFYTEQLLKSINVKMGINAARDKYWNITKNLLVYLEPSLTSDDIKDNRNHLILNTPAQIRNTLHNNGYAGMEFDIVVDERILSFKKGQLLVGTGWITLYKIFGALTELLLEILNNPKIRNIRDIPELYPSEQGI